MRRSSASAVSGCSPNQYSRTMRASSIGGLLVGLEQLLELLRGLDRGRAELALILLDRVLRGERRLVMHAEAAHRLARGRRGRAERLEHPACHLEARGVGLTHHDVDSQIH